MSRTPDIREWLSAMTNRRITAVEIADILDVSRTTATARIAKGLTAEDVIVVSRGLKINPVEALAELGYVTYAEVMTFMDSNGTLVDNASEGFLALELARRLNPATKAPYIDELAARRSNVHRLPSSASDMPSTAVADSSPEEDWEGAEFD